MCRVLIAGSRGLTGSEVAVFFSRHDDQVSGIDDNHRAIFFRLEGDTSWVLGQREARATLITPAAGLAIGILRKVHRLKAIRV